jgi:hypothetical protein
MKIKTKKHIRKKKNRFTNIKIGGDDTKKANTIDDGTLPIFKIYFSKNTRLKDIFYDSNLYSRLMNITPNLSLKELVVLFIKTNQLTEKKYKESEQISRKLGYGIQQAAYWLDPIPGMGVPGIAPVGRHKYVKQMIRYLMYLYEIIQLIVQLNNYDLIPYLENFINRLKNIENSENLFPNLKDNYLDNFAILDIEKLSNTIPFENINEKIQKLKNYNKLELTDEIFNEVNFNLSLKSYKTTFDYNPEINLNPFTFVIDDEKKIVFDIYFLIQKQESFKETINNIPDNNQQKQSLLETFLAYSILINSFYSLTDYLSRRNIVYDRGLVFVKTRNVYNVFKENIIYLKSYIDNFPKKNSQFGLQIEENDGNQYQGGSGIKLKIRKKRTRKQK